jgi:hypothetical protein
LAFLARSLGVFGSKPWHLARSPGIWLEARAFGS